MLLSPWTILKEAWQINKANYKTFFRILLWLLLPALLLTILNFVDRETNLKLISYSVPIYLALVALSFVIGLWTQIVLVRLIMSGLTSQPVNQKELNQNSWRDTISFFWVYFLTGLIILIGTIFFIIPGLIFMVWYFFSTFFFIIEGVNGYAALQKSKEFVQGRFWQVVWRLIMINFFYGLTLIVLTGVPVLLIGALTKFAGFSLSSNAAPWWFDSLQSLVAILTMPLNLGMATILYKNLKENK